MNPNPLDRQAVRTRFGRAAATYAEAAVVQREVGSRLLDRFDVMRLTPTRIVDAGCGPGTHTAALAARFPAATITALRAPRLLSVTAISLSLYVDLNE